MNKNNKLIYKNKINKISKLFYEEILITKLKNISNNLVNTILNGMGKQGSEKTTICNILKKNIQIIYNYLILIVKVMIILPLNK